MTENLMQQLATEQNPLERIIVTKDKTPKACLANALLMLRHDPAWDGVLAFNEFSLHVVTKNPAPWMQNAGANWTDHDDSKTAEWLQHEGILVQSHIAAEAVQTVARDNRFHPVRDYLKGLKWDGKARIDTWLLDYMGVTDSTFARAVGPRWLIAAVARIFRPGCQSDHTLLLEGNQGIGKSTALRVLAGDEWFTDHISDLGSKDSRIELCGKWIVEMAELDTVRRGELDRVKAFLTARADHFRVPYGRRAESVPRSCVFAATTNNFESLTDGTGARRFWPARCSEINIPGLKLDREQLWAEAYRRYSVGEVWWLDSQELSLAAAAEQDARYEPDPWDDAILAWCDNPHRRGDASEPCNSDVDRVLIEDVLVHAIGKPLDRIMQMDRKRVTKCFRHAGWKQGKQDRTRGKTRGKRFWYRTEGEQ